MTNFRDMNKSVQSRFEFYKASVLFDLYDLAFYDISDMGRVFSMTEYYDEQNNRLTCRGQLKEYESRAIYTTSVVFYGYMSGIHSFSICSAFS